MDRDRFAAHIEANRQRYFDELYALLRQPQLQHKALGSTRLPQLSCSG